MRDGRIRAGKVRDGVAATREKKADSGEHRAANEASSLQSGSRLRPLSNPLGGGLMREEPGPVGFKPGARWLITPVPRDKEVRHREKAEVTAT